MNKKFIMFIIFLSLLIFILPYNWQNKNFNYEIDKRLLSSNNLFSEELLHNFIITKLTSTNGGIFTNYLETKKTYEYATGHEILSESIGLMMLYYASIQNKEKFDQYFSYIEKYLVNEGIKWRIKEDNLDLSNSNALIDDLRILRATIYANQLWGESKYYNFIKKVSSLLLIHTYQNMVSDYYQLNSNNISNELHLSYLDLSTMEKLQVIDRRWQDIYKKSIQIIENGLIKQDFPFYYQSYNLDTNSYHTTDMNMIENLLVLLHLSEVGKLPRAEYAWLKNEIFNNGFLYAQYDSKTFLPLNKTESTAVYALIARIALNYDDDVLYQKAIKKMLRFQVKNLHSLIYGAFGNEESLEVFSFDNLQALLALRGIK